MEANDSSGKTFPHENWNTDYLIETDEFAEFAQSELDIIFEKNPHPYVSELTFNHKGEPYADYLRIKARGGCKLAAHSLVINEPKKIVQFSFLYEYMMVPFHKPGYAKGLTSQIFVNPYAFRLPPNQLISALYYHEYKHAKQYAEGFDIGDVTLDSHNVNLLRNGLLSIVADIVICSQVLSSEDPSLDEEHREKDRKYMNILQEKFVELIVPYKQPLLMKLLGFPEKKAPNHFEKLVVAECENLLLEHVL